MITFWVFSGLAVISSGFATVVSDSRRSVLFLWLAGLSVAGIYLDLGAETLALIQAITCTTGAIVSLFFVLLFGEHISSDERTSNQRLAAIALPSLIGCSFSVLIWLSLKDLALANPAATIDLKGLGASILGRHLISAELLAVALLISVVGAGVIARPEVST